MSEDAGASQLTAVLTRAKELGFLGPGPVTDHIDHVERYGRALLSSGSAVRRFADIGAGGGVPGLVMLMNDPKLEGVLIDAAQRRCSFLVWAVATLEIQDRTEVWCGRAEEIGRQERARAMFDGVVARGFGPPASTLECATPLVCDGGVIVISEPPVPRRWPTDALNDLGLAQLQSDSSVAVFERRGELAEKWPRSAKRQQRQPLFKIE